MPADDTVRVCSCCGGQEFASSKVLWPALIEEWRLAPYEADYVDRQQGLVCRGCGSNLRTMALALAILRAYGKEGTFRQFVEDPANRRLRVLEVNEAGQLTQFLKHLAGWTFAKYPDVDMTRMPYRDSSFDLVVHSDTLEHVPQPIRALSECCRVIAPDGFCVFTVPVIVDRLTVSRAGLAPSYHGDSRQRSADYLVQTEYGCDVWKQVLQAGFGECRVVAKEFPSALALVASR